MEQLQNLLNALGLNPIWASIILVLAAVLTFFVKRYYDELSKRREREESAKIAHQAKIADYRIKYVPAQEKALVDGHRMLYENPQMQEARGERFTKIVKEADETIMRPACG